MTRHEKQEVWDWIKKNVPFLFGIAISCGVLYSQFVVNVQKVDYFEKKLDYFLQEIKIEIKDQQQIEREHYNEVQERLDVLERRVIILEQNKQYGNNAVTDR